MQDHRRGNRNQQIRVPNAAANESRPPACKAKRGAVDAESDASSPWTIFTAVTRVEYFSGAAAYWRIGLYWLHQGENEGVRRGQK